MIGTSTDAITYLALAERALQDNQRPFVAFANLLNRLSTRSCVRIALYDKDVRYLICQPSLAERIRASLTFHAIRAGMAPSVVDQDWLRTWKGDLASFESICFHKAAAVATSDATLFAAFANSLAAALCEIAEEYRRVRGVREFPLFQAIQDSAKRPSLYMGDSARLAKAFLERATRTPLVEYLMRWGGKYEEIERSHVLKRIERGPMCELRQLGSSQKGFWSLVYESETEAISALERSSTFDSR